MTYYFMAIGDQHDIRQVFSIQSQRSYFEAFINSFTFKFLQDMQLTKGNTTGDALNKANLKLVNDVLLYHHFLYEGEHYVKADNPT